MDNNKISVLIITGPVGVGKTAASYAVSELLTEKSIPNAVIDMDTLRSAFPRPKSDPFNSRFGFKNLQTLWPNYAELGIQHLIIPNVIEKHSDIDPFKKAIPHAEVMVARLVANTHTLHQRLEGRETGNALAWSKRRAVELADIFDREKVEDIVVTNENKTINDVAEEIIANWLH